MPTSPKMTRLPKFPYGFADYFFALFLEKTVKRQIADIVFALIDVYAIVLCNIRHVSDGPVDGRHRFLSDSSRVTMPCRPENTGTNGDYDKETPEAIEKLRAFCYAFVSGSCGVDSVKPAAAVFSNVTLLRKANRMIGRARPSVKALAMVKTSLYFLDALL